jgi:hypothetical protein
MNAEPGCLKRADFRASKPRPLGPFALAGPDLGVRLTRLGVVLRSARASFANAFTLSETEFEKRL